MLINSHPICHNSALVVPWFLIKSNPDKYTELKYTPLQTRVKTPIWSTEKERDPVKARSVLTPLPVTTQRCLQQHWELRPSQILALSGAQNCGLSVVFFQRRPSNTGLLTATQSVFGFRGLTVIGTQQWKLNRFFLIPPPHTHSHCFIQEIRSQGFLKRSP